MRDPVEISLRGIAHSAVLERYIGEEVVTLDQICDHLLACRVVAQVLQLPKRQGVRFAVGVSVTLPGTEVVVNREHREDVFVALRDAFDAARLQLEEHVRRQADRERGPRSAMPGAKRGC